MWLRILKKHWKISGLILSVLIFFGSFYLLYEKNISLEKEIQRQEIVIEDKTEEIKVLADEKEKIQKITIQNTKQKNTLADRVNKLQGQLQNIQRESIKNEEKGSECLNVREPESLNKWLREYPGEKK